MAVEYDYFNWRELFVNDIAGSEWLFIALSFVVIMVIAAHFRLPNSVTMMIIAFYAIVMSAFFSTLLPLVLFMVGLFVGLALIKAFYN